MNLTSHRPDSQNRHIPMCLFPSNFNGKEKDCESGFHYYGARYYWSELLSGWLSVDPMLDKYPGTSPYAYCIWNPIKVVDPNGDTCRFATVEDEEYVKGLLDKNSKVYSPEFAKKYYDLDDATHNYIFESWNYSDERNESGMFIPNSSENTSKIIFTKGSTPETKNPIIGASEYRVLFEETFHAWKFEKNERVNVPSCLSEAMAWKFSSMAPGTVYFDKMSRDLTLMGHLHLEDVKDVAWEFKYGFSNKRYSLTPLYPDLILDPNDKFRMSIGYTEWK